ncbi:hypothetical protein, partial [Celeribacter halophilus]|uniref:hypothetical protein n=1 Tax=Celeribacter halophilus TaxID=576117 RepID=UPI003F733D81
DKATQELSERAELLGKLRDLKRREARVSATVIEGKEQAGATFSDYFDHSE